MKGPTASLVFLSDEPDRSHFEEPAQGLGIRNNIAFTGFLDEKTKVQFFQHASIIAMNSGRRGLSQTVLETASAGKPAVTGYDREVEQTFGSALRLPRSHSVDEPAYIPTALLDGKETKPRTGLLRKKDSRSRNLLTST
jgi:glycosyltransferase involved in cell wall biosynthesis